MKKDIRYKITVYDFKSALFVVEELPIRLDLLVLTCINKSSKHKRYTLYRDKKTALCNVNCNDLFTLSFKSFVDAVYFVYVN